MRTIEYIDAELRVLAAYRAACAATGDPVRSTSAADRLLDERGSHQSSIRATRDLRLRESRSANPQVNG